MKRETSSTRTGLPSRNFDDATSIAVLHPEVYCSADGGATWAPDREASSTQHITAIIDELVRLLGGDLSGPHQFGRVAEAMVELDRPDLALDWATRGIEKTSGWQIANLRDLACIQAGSPSEALRLRRAHHERTPSGSTDGALRSAAGACDAWHLEHGAARQALERSDRRAVSALLDDGDDELAWNAASRSASDELGQELLLRLADRRQSSHPSEALIVYRRVVDEILVETDRRACRRAVTRLARGRRFETRRAHTRNTLARHNQPRSSIAPRGAGFGSLSLGVLARGARRQATVPNCGPGAECPRAPVRPTRLRSPPRAG